MNKLVLLCVFLLFLSAAVMAGDVHNFVDQERNKGNENEHGVLSIERDTTDVQALIAKESEDVDTLAAEPTETAPPKGGRIHPDEFNTDKFIADRFILRGSELRTCSFTCDHKQENFVGCLCSTRVTYQTRLRECPTDVTRVNSQDLKWAWQQCINKDKNTNCICPTLGQTIKMQRSSLIAAIMRVIDLTKARIVRLYHIVRDVFVSKEWKYNTQRVLINAFVHAKNYIQNIIAKLKLKEQITKLNTELTTVKDKFNKFKNKMFTSIKEKAKEIGAKIQSVGSKWKELGQKAKKQLGLTGAKLLDKLRSWELKVQKFNTNFKSKLKKIKNEIDFKAQSALKNTKKTLSKAWNNAHKLWNVTHQKTKTALKNSWNKTKAAVNNSTARAKAVVNQVKNSAANIVNAAKDKIKNVVRI